VDLVLISAVMAGVKRSTGLTLKTNNIESKDAKSLVERYLDVGEWVFDASVAFMGNSAYCERKR
jgi:hypothetical protein